MFILFKKLQSQLLNFNKIRLIKSQKIYSEMKSLIKANENIQILIFNIKLMLEEFKLLHQ